MRYAVAAAALSWAAVWLALRVLPGGPWLRRNYRDAPVSLLAGPVLAVTLAGTAVTGRTGVAAALAALGSGVVGGYDDLRGETATKGFGGHLRALRHGRVTSGTVKIVAIGAVALGAAALVARGVGVLGAAVVVAGCANLANLFDLRPGRALKVGALAAAALLPAAGPVAGWVLGCALGVLPADLRERVMIGDAGANALGAAVGVALAASVHGTALAAAAAAVVALTLVSERVSFSRVIDRVAPLRWFDRLGRVAPR